jgi:hypothetical protein
MRLEAQGGVLTSAVAATTLRVLRLAVSATLSLLAFIVGYFLIQQALPNPSARVARDLPLAEHLDEYRDVGTFEFLQELVESPEFNADRD